MANSFTLDVKKFADQFDEGAEVAIRGTTIKLWEAIILGSPVDEGRFRANWFASDSNPSDKVTDSKDREGTNTVSTAAINVNSQVDWTEFTLTNNLPYAEVIEFGWYGDGDETIGGFSKQAPTGVLRVTIKRFNRLLKAEAKRALPK